jgi:hypothetical protein
MSDTTTDPSEEQIADLARKYWEEEGQPEGKADEHWTRAQEQLRNGATGAGSNGDSGQSST